MGHKDYLGPLIQKSFHINHNLTVPSVREQNDGIFHLSR